jgi:ATP-dependent Clp protease ATP-binding subunit ClpA
MIEAHPDVFNGVLQRLDDGRSTDSPGRTVGFKHPVIIMTSNIGSSLLLEGVHGSETSDGVRESVMAELRKSFRPEFLNRVDETILFKPLSLEEITSAKFANRRKPGPAILWSKGYPELPSRGSSVQRRSIRCCRG